MSLERLAQVLVPWHAQESRRHGTQAPHVGPPEREQLPELEDQSFAVWAAFTVCCLGDVRAVPGRHGLRVARLAAGRFAAARWR